MIKITVEGDKELAAGFNALADDWINLRRVREELRDAFHEFEAQNFASNDWTPLSPDYAKQKAKTHPGKPILRRTDALFKQLTVTGGIRVTKYTIAIGAQGPAARYGIYHQTGTNRMPARPPIDLTDQQFEKMAEIINKDSAKFARKQGFKVAA